MMSTELGVSIVKTLRSRGVAVTGCHGCCCHFGVEVELLPIEEMELLQRACSGPLDAVA